MSKPLGYLDAVKLLGGNDNKIISILDRTLGAALLVGSAVNPAALALFDAKSQLIKLGHELTRSLSDRKHGWSRHDRTQRLAAAHDVIVVTAFYEAMQGVTLPFSLGSLELSAEEQLAIAASGGAALPLPEPRISAASFSTALRTYYGEVLENLKRFISGLAVMDGLDEREIRAFAEATTAVPALAVARYEDMFRQLAADFPEVALWSATSEHRRTQLLVESALSRLEGLLVDLAGGTTPDQRRSGLARAYAADLARPIVESGDVPDGLRLPTLGKGYVTPRFQTAAPGHQGRPSEEWWWERVDVRDDLEEFFAGYLTLPIATATPLLVLGQPGSGKSVLTRVLAARLAASSYFPIRVILREVAAASDIQDQIEQAIRAVTGESLTWPALVRSAGEALPVVLLDGFDELLQATGVSQSDYLSRVAAFQQREADQGRPVAVIVTSRISVADRARIPEGAFAVRLLPFDADRVGRWLEVWNTTNATHFERLGINPLSAKRVLRHPDLAGQPLLLLMLALYDAEGNALTSAGELGKADLYERLLRAFAEREVVKHQRGLSEGGLADAVERELQRLSTIAFAMFNRGTQWVADTDLELDLNALFGAQPGVTSPGLRPALRSSEIALGRFFFVHRTQATDGDERMRTYEFLHATFGEFLVARFTWQAAKDVAARDAASTLGMSARPVDDDLLFALTSFTPLSARRPVLEFLAELATRGAAADREKMAGVLVRLFQGADEPKPGRAFGPYLPRPLSTPARLACYSANLLLLAITASGALEAHSIWPEETIPQWTSRTLFWRSQFTIADWRSLVDVLTIERVWGGPLGRDIRFTLLRQAGDPPAIDLAWTFRKVEGFDYMISTEDVTQWGRRFAHLTCDPYQDLMESNLESVRRQLGEAEFLIDFSEGLGHSLLRTILDLMLPPVPGMSPEKRVRDYRIGRLGAWQSAGSAGIRLVLDRLATDIDIPVGEALAILDSLQMRFELGPHATAICRCILTHLDRTEDDAERRRFAQVFADLGIRDAEDDDDYRNLTTLECYVRLAEVGALSNVEYGAVDTEFVARRRPDLVRRLELLGESAPGDEAAQRASVH